MKHKFKKGQRVRVTKESLERMERNVRGVGKTKVDEWRRHHKLGGVVHEVEDVFGVTFLRVHWEGEKLHPNARINGAELEVLKS